MFCRQCGKKLPEDAKFCSFCGAPVPITKFSDIAAPLSDPEPTKQSRPKKKKTLWILGGSIITLALIAVIVFVFLNPSKNGLDLEHFAEIVSRVNSTPWESRVDALEKEFNLSLSFKRKVDDGFELYTPDKPITVSGVEFRQCGIHEDNDQVATIFYCECEDKAQTKKYYDMLCSMLSDKYGIYQHNHVLKSLGLYRKIWTNTPMGNISVAYDGNNCWLTTGTTLTEFLQQENVESFVETIRTLMNDGSYQELSGRIAWETIPAQKLLSLSKSGSVSDYFATLSLQNRMSIIEELVKEDVPDLPALYEIIIDKYKNVHGYDGTDDEIYAKVIEEIRSQINPYLNISEEEKIMYMQNGLLPYYCNKISDLKCDDTKLYYNSTEKIFQYNIDDGFFFWDDSDGNYWIIPYFYGGDDLQFITQFHTVIE